MHHLTTDELTAGLPVVREAPADGGRLELIVRRPAVDERELLDEGSLDPSVGLVGDTWIERGSSRTPDGSSDPERQITIMNVRAAALFAIDPDRRALAGDQLYVDLDIGTTNLPTGTRLAIGTAILEVTDKPHTGCKKFSARFGSDAWRLVNAPVGVELRLRGLNARVVQAGVVHVGDVVTKVADHESARV
jgi:hypothetical protein